MENKMLCCDCPYGYEDYVRLYENFTDLSQEEKQDIWDAEKNLLEQEMLLKLN